LTSLEGVVDKIYGNDPVDKENKRSVKKIKKKDKESESNYQLVNPKRSYSAYKYSIKGKGALHESVILSGQPTFLTYEDDLIKTIETIEESSRIIKPPNPEEYPYEPYEFADINEALAYLEKTRKESLDTLFERAMSIVGKYNDQDKQKLVLVASDIIWSYFQDKFSTTHYVGVVGDNGSGKSTVGDTFEAIGYRVVNMTDPTAANIFRVLGRTEAGQCCIVADEAEKIDKSSDIMTVLKTGYQIKGKVARMNMNNETQQFFYTYCLKMIIAERSPSQSDAKGVLDRTFLFTSYKGKSEHDIKEVLNPAGDEGRQKLLDELTDFRKIMLVYRLLHFKDPIPDVDIGLDGRDKELCKPLIQLFNKTASKQTIRSALQEFLDFKHQRKGNLIEAALHPIIVNLLSEYGRELTASQVWSSVKETLDGMYDEKRPNEFQSADYGMIYRNTITNIICDKFGATRKHTKNGSLLTFDLEKLVKIGRAYNLETNIQTTLEEGDGGDGSDGSTNSVGTLTHNFNTENGSNKLDMEKNITNPGSIIKDIKNLDNNGSSHSSPEPSQLSQPSPIYRLGSSDIFACHNCRKRGDKWFMQQHECKENTNENQ
jgi:hypothetical protein